MKPLVSILIGAFNAERTIAETLQSAIAQTWPRTEIIVVDDGSTDQTRDVVRQFKGVTLIPAKHAGVSATVNNAFSRSQGDYIQYLDSDDLLAPDKIERQLLALEKRNNSNLLASAPWTFFFRRTRNARFICNSLCQDLTPVDWLLRKMTDGAFMGNATWLIKRDLVEKAGPWNTELHYDQDGEFFCRALLASEGTCFVPETGMYYRRTSSSSVSFIGNSDRKKESLMVSLKLHVKYLLSLEDSERTRAACVKCLQNWFHFFYQSRPDLAAESESLAISLGGQLTPPVLSWKYAWIQKVWNWQTATAIQMNYNKLKADTQRVWDNVLFNLERRSLTQA